MNKMIGWGLALFGGYYVLKAMGIDPLASIEGTIAGGTATSPQAANPTSTASNTLVTAIANKAIAAKVDLNSYQTVDYWNVFYVAAKGTPGPAPEELFPANDRNNTYTFAQYGAQIVSKGLSGLGQIAHYVNPYHNPMGQPFGSYLTPLGVEKFLIEKGN